MKGDVVKQKSHFRLITSSLGVRELNLPLVTDENKWIHRRIDSASCLMSLVERHVLKAWVGSQGLKSHIVGGFHSILKAVFNLYASVSVSGNLKKKDVTKLGSRLCWRNPTYRRRTTSDKETPPAKWKNRLVEQHVDNQLGVKTSGTRIHLREPTEPWSKNKLSIAQ